MKRVYVFILFFLNSFLWCLCSDSSSVCHKLCFVGFYIRKSSCRQEEERWADESTTHTHTHTPPAASPDCFLSPPACVSLANPSHRLWLTQIRDRAWHPIPDCLISLSHTHMWTHRPAHKHTPCSHFHWFSTHLYTCIHGHKKSDKRSNLPKAHQMFQIIKLF